MCGIAGLIRFAGLRPEERHRGVTMAHTLQHRGPDDVGLFADRWASLGHARLSIIDPDGGHQPMGNEDGRVQVVFNGEIYNHRELADQLRDRGHSLKTHCDTEVIAHLYEDFGQEFVHKLNGMFAIAVWDAGRRELLLVRDRMGIKPLYWCTDGQFVAFGSELKAVLAAGQIDPQVDPLAIKDYLTFGHVPAPRTIYTNVHKLEPGYLATFAAGGRRVRQYWDIPFAASHEAVDPQRATDAFADLLEQSVRMRLEADVPLGAFLSGGVDSAAVVAAMCRNASGSVLTHTVGFKQADHDERGRAREVAARLGTDHREIVVDADAVSTAERLVRHFDEPFADSCAVPAYHLARFARERVTVALAGDGPDEMLAGYRRYRFDLAESAARNLAPAWLRRSTLGVAGWLYPKADWLPRPLRAKRTLQNLACDDASAHLRSVAIAAGELPDTLLCAELVAELDDYDPFAHGRELFARCESRELLDRLLYMDMKTLLADDILTKVDRTSMAVGLEVRVPILDYRLVELSARLPVSLKLANGQGKQILRQVAGRWLGPEHADTPKHGFDVPVDGWFRGPLREMLHDTILSPNAACRQWLEPACVNRLVHQHVSGVGCHGRALWSLLMLELWKASMPASNFAETGADARGALSVA